MKSTWYEVPYSHQPFFLDKGKHKHIFYPSDSNKCPVSFKCAGKLKKV